MIKIFISRETHYGWVCLTLEGERNNELHKLPTNCDFENQSKLINYSLTNMVDRNCNSVIFSKYPFSVIHVSNQWKD